MQGLLDTPVDKYPLDTQEVLDWLVQKINKEGLSSESLKDFVLLHLDQSSAQSLSDSTDFISHLASVSLAHYSTECKHEITSLIIYADKTQYLPNMTHSFTDPATLQAIGSYNIYEIKELDTILTLDSN